MKLDIEEIKKKEWITGKEFEVLFSWSRSSIAKFRAQGMPHSRGPSLVDPKYRYNQDEVRAWLKLREVMP